MGCRPVASLDHFTAETLGNAELVQEEHVGDGKIVKVSCLVFKTQQCGILSL